MPAPIMPVSPLLVAPLMPVNLMESSSHVCSCSEKLSGGNYMFVLLFILVLWAFVMGAADASWVKSFENRPRLTLFNLILFSYWIGFLIYLLMTYPLSGRRK